MAVFHRSLPGLGVVVLTALVLAGCSSSRFGGGRDAAPSVAQPGPAMPVTTSSVQSSDLPPIGGATTLPSPASSSTPIQGSSADGGFASLDQVASPATTTASGRDLSGTVTIEKLLGGWTIMAGAEQCRLNLTYTAKGATGRYRASTPACTQQTLAEVTSWQLLGNQIQLYNEADQIVGTLLKSGNRFVGTLAGGQSISMEG